MEIVSVTSVALKILDKLLAKEPESATDLATLSNTILQLQNHIADLTNQKAALNVETQILKEKIAALRDWSEEKPNYKLARIGSRTTVYKLKDEIAILSETPKHYLCPACFHEGKKSILQPGKTRDAHEALCPACGVIAREGGFILR